jgi:SAM-dependent methyltransferase
MLNAMLDKPTDVEMVGVDLSIEGVRRANVFAAKIPGFSNCRFEVADLSTRLPFGDNAFDAVNLCDVIEHMVRPGEILKELCRIAKPGGTLVISTPLKNSLFKRMALFANRLVGGRLYKVYYKGKDTELDDEGNPVMDTLAGNDHISEMTLPVLKRHCETAGFSIEEVNLMSVMSGSRWFDRHLVLLAGILFIEAIHAVLKRPSWAHSVMLRLRKKT